LSEVPIAVLASGHGSNFQALLDAELSPGRIVLLISNKADAHALVRAARAGVPSTVIDHRRFASREAFDTALVAKLSEVRAEWVVFAGFMRVVTDVLLVPFHHRVVNVHPALLPAFPGVNAQAQAYSAGVKITGCTVHLVDSGVDTGPILAQAAVPVLPTDELQDLQQRILKQEHALLPAVVRALAEGRLGKDALGRPSLAGFEAARWG
jgi:phosphoribosylglycinamide formyltransferase 1